jgi:hypothetical protein
VVRAALDDPAAVDDGDLVDRPNRRQAAGALTADLTAEELATLRDLLSRLTP